MNFPAGPINGQTTTINGIVYIYDDTKTAWKRSTSFAGNLTILGNVTSANVVTGNVYTSGGIYWSNNGAAYSSGGGSSFVYTASASAPGSPTKGDQWFDTTDGTLYEYIDDGDSFQWVDIQTPTFASNAVVTSLSGDVSTSGNISASSVVITSGIFWSNGVAFASSLYSNVNVEAYIGANVGSLLVNAAAQATSLNTINANLGAYQTWANATLGTTYSNANVVANLQNFVTTINSTANIITTANIYSSNIITTGTTGNISGVSHIFATNYVYPNGVSILSGIGGTYSNTNVSAYLTQGANIGSGTTISNLVAAATTTSSSTTTGALVVRGGAGIAGAVYIGGDLRVTASSVAVGTTSGALVVTGGLGIGGDAFFGGLFQSTNGIDSTSPSTGSFTVQNNGGIGVAGNVHASKLYTLNGVFWSSNNQLYLPEPSSKFTSNIVAGSGDASTNTTTGALVVAGSGGLGVGGSLNATAGSTVNGWTVGGLLWAACTSPATSATSGGGLLVDGGARFTGNIYASGNIYLGANTSSNLIANATTTSTSTTTGSFVVRGGAGVAGNLYVGNEFVVPGGGKITSTGLAYLLEKANIVATSPATTVNVDMSTVAVMYWTGNATANVTANIRGTATQPLNSLLATGQSVTAVLFLPNGPSNYLVNSVKIDNTTVTPAYQGNAAPVLGNSNSIDIYSFTILKTADATYKIFASQTQFMHPG